MQPLGEARALDCRQNGQQSPEQVCCADKPQSAPNTSPQAETLQGHPSPLTLVGAAHRIVCGIREAHHVSGVLCLTPPPPRPAFFERACLLFSLNRRGIQLHLCRQALSPNLTSLGNITKTENSGDI